MSSCDHILYMEHIEIYQTKPNELLLNINLLMLSNSYSLKFTREKAKDPKLREIDVLERCCVKDVEKELVHMVLEHAQNALPLGALF